MPSTMTYLISRAWMRRSNSCVEMPSRRAAWLTRNNSDDIGTTVRVVEFKSTAEQPDLCLNIDDGDEPIRVDQSVASVLKGRQQSKGLVERVRHRWRWFVVLSRHGQIVRARRFVIMSATLATTADISGGSRSVQGQLASAHVRRGGGPPGDRTRNPRIKRCTRRYPQRCVSVRARAGWSPRRPSLSVSVRGRLPEWLPPWLLNGADRCGTDRRRVVNSTLTPKSLVDDLPGRAESGRYLAVRVAAGLGSLDALGH
jgi:hypothetical protein